MLLAKSLLKLVLVLLLLTQGVAIASSPAKSEVKLPHAVQALPCHGMSADMAMPKTEASAKSAACCDASCPDMTSCALSSAALPTPPAFTLPLANRTVAAPDVDVYPPAPVGSRLRPPISLPA
jgi:hypothetical protein